MIRRCNWMYRWAVAIAMLSVMGLLSCSSANGDAADLEPTVQRTGHLLPIQYDEPLPRGDIRNIENCAEYPFEAPLRGAWNELSNKKMSEQADPAHRSTDRVTAVGDAIHLGATMAYGEDPLASEWVRLFVGDCQGWSQIGVRKTDDDGQVAFQLDKRLSAGVYGVVFQAVGDSSFVRSQLWVVPRDTRVIGFDLDGAAFDVPEATDAMDSLTPVQGASPLTLWHANRGRLVVYVERSNDRGSGAVDLDQWRDHLRREGFAVGPVVDLGHTVEPQTSREHQLQGRPGWGHAGSFSSPGPGISTALAKLYTADSQAADTIRQVGLQPEQTILLRDLCAGSDGDECRTGWKELLDTLDAADDGA